MYFSEKVMSSKKENDAVLSSEDATQIYGLFEELQYKMTHHPFDDDTQNLKIEFVDMLDEKGLIPAGFTRDSLISTLNPTWFTV